MSERPVVFVAWDSQLKAVEQTFVGIRDDPDGVDVEIVGALDDLAVGRLSRRLEEAVARGAAVLAVVDQPNANMAWELGMALASGRSFALATEAQEVGTPWIEGTPLGAVLRQPDIAQHARALLERLAEFEPAPARPEPGERKLLLCSPRGTGKELHRALTKHLVPQGWELIDTRGWTVAGLGGLLEDAGRVAWIQLRLRKNEARHGVDNSIGALVAGYAHACEIPVAAFVDEHCPRPLDAHELERHHSGAPIALVEAIREWSLELDRPAPERAKRLFATWWAAVKERHAQPLAYVSAFDLAVAELQPVQLDVDVGGPVDGLECRQHGFEERRHGTLDRLLHEDLDGDGPVRWLLQAEPGAGKTTLLRRIAHQRAGEEGLPVLIPLARWADEGGDPVELAARATLDQAQLDQAPRVARAIRRAASRRGRVWLLFDGFDEVKEHDRVRQELEALARRPEWADSAIVVTSRPSAVKGGTAWAGFTRASLRLLDRTDQELLVAGLLAGHPGQAAAFWRDVAARPGVGVLLPNPFLLTLTVGLFHQGIESGAGTPLNRRTLLQRAVKDCLERGWGVQREAPRPRHWSPRYARRILRGLSLELHRRGSEAWEDDELSDLLGTLPRLYPSLADFCGRDGHWRSDREFLDEVAKYGGLLGPLDGPQAPWRYLHRSLRELLAAECLAEELAPEARGEVVAELMAEQQEGESDGPGRSAEVLALLAGMVDEDEAVGHLEALAQVAPDAGIRALASVEGLDAWRWLGLLVGMKAKDEGKGYWQPHWDNQDLDAVLDAVGRDGPAGTARLWATVDTGLPARTLGLLWYALERLDPRADLLRFLGACGKADLERPRVDIVPIPAGSFQMGAAEADGRDHERPVHAVTLSGSFDLARTPVTLAQYRAFDPDHDNAGRDGATHPAVMVDWFTARLFAAWLGGRLPTEAEWEHACRAGSHTRFWSGDDDVDLARVGWYRENSKRKLQPVAGKPANPWGLHDMHGNVWEWCADRPRDYDGEPAADPAGASRGPNRVLRGGGYWSDAVGCRSATRYGVHPAGRSDYIGFRVVLAAPPPGRS